MSKKSERYVRWTLGEDAASRSRKPAKLMSFVSSWADAVSDDLEWSRELHYANIPSDPRDEACGSFDFMRDCTSQRCIVTAIANYTMRAIDINRPVAERAEALKFLIHFAADAHQPLHNGFKEDAGGCLIGLSRPEEQTLHQVWDDYLVENMIHRLAGSETPTWYGAAEVLTDSYLRSGSVIDIHDDPELGRFPTEERVMSWAINIATETVTTHTCRSAYKDELGHWIERRSSLSDQYIATRSQVVEEQLIKAGVRLARLLDSIAGSFYESQRQLDSAALLGSLRASDAIPVAINPFADLDVDFEFDVDELVYEIVDEDDDEDNEEESEGLALTTERPVESATSTSTKSPEERRREKALKKRLRNKISKRKLFGVDVESVVLIKRGKAYHITDVKLVASESFTPALFAIIMVQFGRREDPLPFLFDATIFPTIPPIELVRAVFKKLKGLDYSAEIAVASDVPAKPTVIPFEEDVAGMAVVGRDGPSESDQARVDERFATQVKPILEMMGIKTVIQRGSLSDIEDVLRPKLSKAELKRAYGGPVPTEEQLAVDILKGQWNDLTSITLGNIWVVSRKDLLIDRSNRRWVFNKYSIINSEKSLTSTSWLYVDVRVLDAPFSRPLAEALEKLAVARSSRDNLREVVRRGSPMLDRIIILGKAIDGDLTGTVQMVAAFETQRFIYRNSPGFSSVEYILREPEGERNVRRILGAPEISKLRLDELILPGGAKWKMSHANGGK